MRARMAGGEDLVELKKVEAPWTPEQLAELAAWQGNPAGHPYTCGSSRHDVPDGPRPPLIADRYGWTCPDPDCDYRQGWALFRIDGGAL